MGEHIKKKRLELGLTQKGASARLGVTLFTVINWENNLRKPRIRQVPAVCAFLGYDPEPPNPRTLPEYLRAKRRQLGWGQRELADHLGVDRCTVTSWELGGTILKRSQRITVARFLGLPEAELVTAMGERWNASHGKRSVTGLKSSAGA